MSIQIKILREQLVDVGWKNTNQGKGGSKWKLMALFPKYVYILSLLSSLYTYVPKSKLNLPVFLFNFHPIAPVKTHRKCPSHFFLVIEIKMFPSISSRYTYLLKSKLTFTFFCLITTRLPVKTHREIPFGGTFSLKIDKKIRASISSTYIYLPKSKLKAGFQHADFSDSSEFFSLLM